MSMCHTLRVVQGRVLGEYIAGATIALNVVSCAVWLSNIILLIEYGSPAQHVAKKVRKTKERFLT